MSFTAKNESVDVPKATETVESKKNNNQTYIVAKDRNGSLVRMESEKYADWEKEQAENENR